jgi:hypothetical protein
MTIIVSIKINDGIVMASDSAGIYSNGQVYNNADKLANLVAGLPVGIMATGTGNIEGASVARIFKDLEMRLTHSDDPHWRIDREGYTMEWLAHRLFDFLGEVHDNAGSPNTSMLIRLCGYSANRPHPEIWDVSLHGAVCFVPKRQMAEDDFGTRWNGEVDALDRILLGRGADFCEAALHAGIPQHLTTKLFGDILPIALSPCFVISAMPIQDAADVARFLVETTIGFVRFSTIKHPKTVGGAVCIATITKYEGFRWIQRRD